MHMSWMHYIGGRLESRYRYSIGLVYNTFPMPSASKAQLAKLEPLAKAVLDARVAQGFEVPDAFHLLNGRSRVVRKMVDQVDLVLQEMGIFPEVEV